MSATITDRKFKSCNNCTNCTKKGKRINCSVAGDGFLGTGLDPNFATICDDFNPIRFPKPPKYIYADYEDGTWAFYWTKREQRSNRPDLKPIKLKVVEA